MILNENLGGTSSSSLVLEDVFDIKAASLDPSTSLFDDDPSLRSFPINNGLFDDDRMGTLWKPSVQPKYDEITILDTTDPPLHVLLGRTVDDCFRDFPSPSNHPSPLSNSTSSTPDTSPWCEHWHPLPKQDPDPAIDVVLDEMNQKMRIFDAGSSPPGTPEQTPSLHADGRLREEGAGALDVTNRTHDSQTRRETGRPVGSATHHPTSRTQISMQEARLQPTAPKASLRPCRSNVTVVAPLSSPPSLSSDSDVEAPHFTGQGSAATTPKDGSSTGVDIPQTVPSPPLSTRTTARRRFDQVEDVDEMDLDSRPPKKVRTSASPNAGSGESSTPAITTRRRGRISTSPGTVSSGSSSRPGRPKKRYKCPEPWCGSTFSRLGDVNRHLKNAAAHVTSIAQLDERARCSKCGENLSRADARKRHELKGSCGKRTIRKRGVAMPRIPQA